MSGYQAGSVIYGLITEIQLQRIALRLVIHPSTAQSYAYEIIDGWNPRLTSLSSHTKRSVMVWGFPAVELKTLRNWTF
jgi:hypothetical protein